MPRPSAVLTVDPDDPDPSVLERVGEALRGGALVAFPTETVYGLGVHARDLEAISAVFEGKGRPPTDPLIVHVDSVDHVHGVVSSWPVVAQRLAEAFWPGPLTLVLPRAAEVPAQVAAGRATVAVRVPAHPVALGLLRHAGVPVAAPSANRFGRVSPTTAQHVIDELHGVYDLLLDGGPTTLGVESTVVDLTSEVPEMLRPGGVTLEDLTAVLGTVTHRERAAVAESTPAAAPGEFLRHYAPATPLVLVDGSDRIIDELVERLGTRGITVGVLGLDPSAEIAARRLYAVLRHADTSGASVLLARTVDPAGIGRAVNDRLFRAAHGRLVLDSSRDAVERIAGAAGRA